jgi:dTDP-4-amino-4,6-dideoxygalactose transaminase
MITPRTTGIIGVHTFGHMCEADALEEIARRHHLRLLFDAAHALGCTYKGRHAGSHGDAEMLSFHATKVVNAFEGGAVLTNNDELARKMRLMKNFGFAGYDDVIYIGTNGKMSEVSAAMGLTSLESFDDFIAVNRRNYQAYRRGLEGIPGISLMGFDETEKNNYQYIVLEVDKDSTRLSRDALMKVLWAENVLARRYFHPGCHRMEPYRSHYPHAGLLLPATEILTPRLLQLPTGTAVSEPDIRGVCEIIRVTVEKGDEVSARLRDMEA